jgi:hypothetical protein
LVFAFRLAFFCGFLFFKFWDFFWPLGQLVVKGHSKKKVTDPYVVGWFLGGQKSTRVGQIFFGDFFYRVFELPSPRNAQKRDKKKIEKQSVWDFLVDFFVKNFSTRFFCKTFL